MIHILEFLNKSMERPTFHQGLFNSWFHNLFLLLTMIGIIWAVKYFKRSDERLINRFLIIFSIVLILFEIYKQIIFTYQAQWSYQWYAFPFQFCSTPMYIALIAGFTKHKPTKDALLAFLATYGTFAGLGVMIYPETVFVETIGINIQTMVHHGGMTILGLGLLFGKLPIRFKSLFKATYVFTGLVAIAVLLNTFHNTFIGNSTFNMFFINPKFSCFLPILEMIQPLVSKFIFTFIYIIGFSFVTFLLMCILNIIKRAFYKLKSIFTHKSHVPSS